MLGPKFSAGHFRSRIEKFFKGAPDGWPCWSFSNHDVNRHLSRWESYAVNPDTIGRLSIGLLSTLKGSICIYQGEELGLPEAELDYSELTDPPGLRFWPENKGRDGCRTPIPWTDAEYGGFSDVKPWLPVKAPHIKRNVAALEADPDSLLHYYRAVLRYRREHSALVDGDIHFLKIDEPILAFGRSNGEDAIVCVFNLSATPHTLRVRGLPENVDLAAISQDAALEDDTLALKGNGFALVQCPAGLDLAAVSLKLKA